MQKIWKILNMKIIKTLLDDIELINIDESIKPFLETDGCNHILSAINSHTTQFNEIIKSVDIEKCDSNYFFEQLFILLNDIKTQYMDIIEKVCEDEGFDDPVNYLTMDIVSVYQGRIEDSGDFGDDFHIDDMIPKDHGINSIDDLDNKLNELIVEHSIEIGILKGVFSKNEFGGVNLTPKFIAPNEDDNGFPFVNFEKFDDDDDYEAPNYPTIEGDLKCQSIWSCEFDPNTPVKSGYTVLIEFIWSHTDDGLTPSKDISITLKDDCILSDALHYLEKEALVYVKSQGADYLRQYYIENVSVDDNLKTIKFGYGT
jgi:hypothetical protein